MKSFLIALCFACSASFAHAIDLPFTKDLFEGMPQNEEVYRLSIVLKKEGFYAGDLTRTFTPALARAVSGFQAKKGINPINGIVGTKTRYELNTIVLGWIGKNITEATQTKKATAPTAQPHKQSLQTTKQTATVKTVPTAVSATERRTAASPQSCVHRGKTYKHGEKVRLYKYTVARSGGVCPSRVRVCVDGQLDGDLSYRHHTCTIPTATASDISDTPKGTPPKQPVLDDGKTTPTNQPSTTPKTPTQPKNDTKPTSGCRAAGISYKEGQTTAGCIGPGKTDPSANQCLAAIMPVWKCVATDTWTCITNCQHNYY